MSFVPSSTQLSTDLKDRRSNHQVQSITEKKEKKVKQPPPKAFVIQPKFAPPPISSRPKVHSRKTDSSKPSNSTTIDTSLKKGDLSWRSTVSISSFTLPLFLQPPENVNSWDQLLPQWANQKHDQSLCLSTPEQLKSMVTQVSQLFQQEVASFQKLKSQIKSTGDQKWINDVLKSGTLSDRVAALALRVQESPIHELASFDQLLAFASQKEQRSSQMAMEAIKDLLIHNLLPSSRQLRPFKSQPFLHKEMTMQTALIMYFEDQLLGRIERLLIPLENGLKSNIDFFKKQSLDVLTELLCSKPQHEAKFLQMIVNKLGDPLPKICSKVIESLKQVIHTHPAMKLVIVREVQQFLFNPHLPPRAIYQSIIFLSQIPLAPPESHPSSTEIDAATQLVQCYLSLFERVISIQEEEWHDEKDQKFGGKSNKGKNQNKGKGDLKNKNNKNDSNEDSLKSKDKENEVELSKRTRLLSALLLGVNRAFPLLNLSEKKINKSSSSSSSSSTTSKSDHGLSSLLKHVDELFRIVHSCPSFATSTQALTLLSHLALSPSLATQQHLQSSKKSSSSSSPSSVDPEDSTSTSISPSPAPSDLQSRYFRALYSMLLSDQILTRTHNTMFLNLLYRSIKFDRCKERVMSFIKRILLLATHCPPPTATGLLLLISEACKIKQQQLQQYLDRQEAKLKKQQQTNKQSQKENSPDDEAKETEDGGKGGLSLHLMLTGSSSESSFVEAETDKENADSEDSDSEDDDEGVPDEPVDDSQLETNEKYSTFLNNYHDLGGYLADKLEPKFAVTPRLSESTSTSSESPSEFGPLLWEMPLLFSHFHPSVKAFVTSLSTPPAHEIAYKGEDPTVEFSLIAFLNRFAYKNPKDKDRAGGSKSGEKENAAAAGRRNRAPEEIPLNIQFQRERRFRAGAVAGSEAGGALDVAPEKKFFYKFFAERERLKESGQAKLTKIEQRKKFRSGEDDEEEEEDDEGDVADGGKWDEGDDDSEEEEEGEKSKKKLSAKEKKRKEKEEAEMDLFADQLAEGLMRDADIDDDDDIDFDGDDEEGDEDEGEGDEGFQLQIGEGEENGDDDSSADLEMDFDAPTMDDEEEEVVGTKASQKKAKKGKGKKNPSREEADIYEYSLQEGGGIGEDWEGRDGGEGELNQRFEMKMESSEDEFEQTTGRKTKGKNQKKNSTKASKKNKKSKFDDEDEGLEEGMGDFASADDYQDQMASILAEINQATKGGIAWGKDSEDAGEEQKKKKTEKRKRF